MFDVKSVRRKSCLVFKVSGSKGGWCKRCLVQKVSGVKISGCMCPVCLLGFQAHLVIFSSQTWRRRAIHDFHLQPLPV